MAKGKFMVKGVSGHKKGKKHGGKKGRKHGGKRHKK
jgi:hypothetical protein